MAVTINVTVTQNPHLSPPKRYVVYAVLVGYTQNNVREGVCVFMILLLGKKHHHRIVCVPKSEKLKIFWT